MTRERSNRDSRTDVGTPNWPEIEAAITAELSQTWLGTRTAKDSVAAAWPKVETLMQQAQAMVRQMPK